MLEAGERVLAGVQHLLRGFPHIPVRLLGEHPAGPGPGAALQRRAAASGSARTGALHSRRQRRLLLLLLPPPAAAGRSAAGGGAQRQLPAGPGVARARLPPSSFPRSPPAASRQPSGATPGVAMATAP